jgi:hypothetical protein
MNMNKFFFLFAFIAFGLTSCKKDLIERATPVSSNSVSKFSEIKASETFDWKTSKAITLQVKGFQSISDAKSTLKVTSLDGKIIFYQAAHAMSETFNTQIMVPSHIKDLSISYGSIQKNVSTSINNISFNYLPEVSGE